MAMPAWLARACLRLYPRAWRDRYGDELLEMLESRRADPRDAADLARGAAVEQMRELRAALMGGSAMSFGPAARHPTAWGIAALVVLLPTALLVVASLVAHELSVPGVASLVDPLIVTLTAPPIVGMTLLFAPALALLIGVLPILRLGWSRGETGWEVGLSVRVQALNIAVTLGALAIGLILVAHHVSESILEAGR